MNVDNNIDDEQSFAIDASILSQLYKLEQSVRHSLCYAARMKTFLTYIAEALHETSPSFLDDFNLVIGSSISSLHRVIDGYIIPVEQSLNNSDSNNSIMPSEHKTRCAAAKNNSNERCSKMTTQPNKLCLYHKNHVARDWPSQDEVKRQEKTETLQSISSLSISSSSSSSCSTLTNQTKASSKQRQNKKNLTETSSRTAMDTDDEEPVNETLQQVYRPNTVLVCTDSQGIAFWPNTNYVLSLKGKPQVIAKRRITSATDYTFEPLDQYDVQYCERNRIPYSVVREINKVHYEMDNSNKGLEKTIEFFKTISNMEDNDETFCIKP